MKLFANACLVAVVVSLPAGAGAALQAPSQHAQDEQGVRDTGSTAPLTQPTSPWKWPLGPSPEESFFPLGVWLQTPSSAQRYRDDMGINTFVGLWTGPTQSNLQTLAASGMPVYVTQTKAALASPNNHVIHAWQQQDEPDNAQPNGQGGYLPCVAPSKIQQIYQEWKAADPHRPVFLNFGQGVANIGYIGRGTCTGQTWMYPEYIKGGDIVSFDIFPATHKDPLIAGKLEYVAIGIENLIGWARESNSGPKIVMNFIGTTNITSTTLSTSPEQIKSTVWMSLIHGSMGILYFVHEFEPTFREDGIYNHPENVAAVSDTNALITTLAPVLNGPTLDGPLAVVSTGRIATMVKRRNGVTYLFAVEMEGKRDILAEFAFPGIPNATVVDLEEGRRPVTFANGRLTDTFGSEGYDAHVYEITPTDF